MSLKTTENAYAKLNLFLDITGTLPNKYHTINSIMQTVNLCDTVEIEVSDGDGIEIRCECNYADIPCNEKNIAYKAAEVFLGELRKTVRVTVSIEKRIPVEAGMGGSSTDGAAVLRGLNRLFDYPFSIKQLCILGNKIGADVPFCIVGGTKICRGTGNEITDIEPLGSCEIAVIVPDFNCNTGKAYKAYDLAPTNVNDGFEEMITALENGNLADTAKKLYNVFQTLYKDERIDGICHYLYDNNALGACLTGSGSAVFGIFPEGTDMSFLRTYGIYCNVFIIKHSSNP